MPRYDIIEARPQPGFQSEVDCCEADIAVIGGSAGGGKTSILVMDVMKWLHIPSFGAVFFRRTMERIRATGGLLAETKKWYPAFGGKLSESILKWRFESGAEVDFEGIEHVKDLDKWMGTQIPVIIFDELTEFEEKMFWFMISRNRGIIRWQEEDPNDRRKKITKVLKPYVRASCNPLPNSWVSRLLEWWIDQDTGYPIEERSGKLRYLINYQDKIYWGDTKDEVIASCPQVFEMMKKTDPTINPKDLIKSFTFIRGKLSDNKILTKNSPEYYSSLLSMPQEDQDRFLGGNWKIAADGLDLFKFAAMQNMFTDSFIQHEKVIVGYMSTGEPIYRMNEGEGERFITCDAARMGQDLCVIYAWQGYTVIAVSIFYESDAVDIKSEIEYLRAKFKVPRKSVIVDQDGFGGSVVKLGGYLGFVARRAAEKDSFTREKENYDSFKDQCYFHIAEKLNEGILKMTIVSDTVRVFFRGENKPVNRVKLRWPPRGGKNADTVELKVLIKNQLAAIKKGESVFEGGEKKYSTNSKDEQKEILGDISPDLADALMMRAYFELVGKRKGKNKVH
jgi:hypothetical protein